jgi:hypothetical protein
MNVAIFWDVASSSLYVSRRFGGRDLFHLQGRNSVEEDTSAQRVTCDWGYDVLFECFCTSVLCFWMRTCVRYKLWPCECVSLVKSSCLRTYVTRRIRPREVHKGHQARNSPSLWPLPLNLQLIIYLQKWEHRLARYTVWNSLWMRSAPTRNGHTRVCLYGP